MLAIFPATLPENYEIELNNQQMHKHASSTNAQTQIAQSHGIHNQQMHKQKLQKHMELNNQQMQNVKE